LPLILLWCCNFSYSIYECFPVYFSFCIRMVTTMNFITVSWKN
jgi:hypothetical protein